MRVIALEEHFLFEDQVDKIPVSARVVRGFAPGRGLGPDKQLGDLGPARIEDMDRAGITMQILSCFGPGPDLLEGANPRTTRADTGILSTRSSNRKCSSSAITRMRRSPQSRPRVKQVSFDCRRLHCPFHIVRSPLAEGSRRRSARLRDAGEEVAAIMTRPPSCAPPMQALRRQEARLR